MKNSQRKLSYILIILGLVVVFAIYFVDQDTSQENTVKTIDTLTEDIAKEEDIFITQASGTIDTEKNVLKDDVVITPVPSVSAIDTSGWKKYNIDALGFSFSYPQEWTLDTKFKKGLYTVRAGQVLEDGTKVYFDVWFHTATIDLAGSSDALVKLDGRTAYEFIRSGECGETTVCLERTVLVTLNEGVRRTVDGVALWTVAIAELRHGTYKEGVSTEASKALVAQEFNELMPTLNKMLALVILTQ